MRHVTSVVNRRMAVANLVALLHFVASCSGSTDAGTAINNSTPNGANNNMTQVHAFGSIIDGPVTQSDISAFTINGGELWTGNSDNHADYSADMLVSPADYPLTLRASGGIDLVSGTKPEFELRSVVAEASTSVVANINSFSTVITSTASQQSVGFSASSIESSTVVVQEQLNFGLDNNRISDPILAPVQNSNVASFIRSSEALAEMIRRTQVTLFESGIVISVDDVLAYLGADLTDGFIDGRGNGSNARVAATASIVGAQILVETMTNELRVGGINASSRMDAAILAIRPETTVLTGDLTVTDKLIAQAGIAVTAAFSLSPSQDLGHLLDALYEMPSGISSLTAKDALPANSISVLDAPIAMLASATDNKLELVNDSVRRSIGPSSVDLFPPIINLRGSIYVSLIIGEPYVESGAIAIDNRDGDISSLVRIDSSSMNIGAVGDYFVTYNVSDSAHNAASEVVRSISVFDPEITDTVAPIITLKGDSPQSIIKGESYIELGAVATDDVDGDISHRINIDNNAVVTELVGDYSVTYNVSDTAGNAADQVIRSVNVIGTAHPWEDIIAEMVGYASHEGVIGGAGKPLITVSNLNDSGLGSLRQAVVDSISDGAWINFSQSLTGTIRLESTIDLTSDITIDGRGADITIEGPGEGSPSLAGRRGDQNFIIMYIRFNGPVDGENDLLNIFNDATDDVYAGDLAERFWIYHVGFTNAGDELLNVRRTHGKYTVQNCYFSNPDGSGFGVLIANSSAMSWNSISQKSTWARNHFDHIRERAPAIFAASNVHLFNNFNENWAYEASITVSEGGMNAQSLWENNVADANGTGKRFIWPHTSGHNSGEINANGNLMLDGAFETERNPENVFVPPYSYQLEVATLALRDIVTAEAGWQNVPFPE